MTCILIHVYSYTIKPEYICLPLLILDFTPYTGITGVGLFHPHNSQQKLYM